METEFILIITGGLKELIKPRCANETLPPYPYSSGSVSLRGTATGYSASTGGSTGDPTLSHPFPTVTGTSPPLYTGASGTAPRSSGADPSSAPYGNKTTTDPSGTAYSSGSLVSSYSHPSAFTSKPSGHISKSSDPSAGSISGKPSISSNATGYYPTGTDPSVKPTGTLPIYSSLSGISSSGFVTSPSSIDPGTTSADSSSKFTYTPSVSSLPSEYYTHHGKKSKHHHVSWSLVSWCIGS